MSDGIDGLWIPAFTGMTSEVIEVTKWDSPTP